MGSRPWPRVVLWTLDLTVILVSDRVKKEKQELLLIPGTKNDWA